MNALELAERLQQDYRRFTWTTYPIADPGLRSALEELVDQRALLWRGPYLSVQPRFAVGERLSELVARLGMPAEVASAFPVAGRLFCHQVAAIERIWAGHNTLVATGTGSGKTEAGSAPGRRAPQRAAPTEQLCPTRRPGGQAGGAGRPGRHLRRHHAA